MKHRKVIAFLTLALLALAAAAQAAEERVLEEGVWYKTAETGLNLTQSAYSDNWNGGDKGSIVWTWLFNGTLENQLNAKANWLNTLKLAYGQTHGQSVNAEGDLSWDRPEKSTDNIDLESLMRFTLGAWVDPFVAGRFESQFHDASDPFDRALALNPMQFKESAGIAKQFVNEEERNLLARLGFTLRQTRRNYFTDFDPAGGYDDATESETGSDGGLELVIDYKTRILDDRVAWTSKLGAYQPFFYSGKSDIEDADLAAAGLDADLADFTTAVDVDWENIFSANITEHIAVSLYVQWIYDKYDNSVVPELDADGDLVNAGALAGAVRKAGQFKQTMALGFTYRLF